MSKEYTWNKINHVPKYMPVYGNTLEQCSIGYFDIYLDYYKNDLSRVCIIIKERAADYTVFYEAFRPKSLESCKAHAIEAFKSWINAMDMMISDAKKKLEYHDGSEQYEPYVESQP